METDIKRRSNNWSWNMIKEHRIRMKEYQQLYKEKLLGKKVDVETLEKQLNLFSIVLARSRAELETQQILEIKKQEPKKGWFSWWGKENKKTEGIIAFHMSTYCLFDRRLNFKRVLLFNS